MRKIFNTIKAGVQAVKEKFVAIHAAAERKIHRISAKIRTAAFRFAVVIGALLLGGLYALFGDTIMPTVTQKVKDMFNFKG